MRIHGSRSWVSGVLALGFLLAGLTALTGLAATQTVAAQALALVAKADDSYIRGVVTNSLTGKPLAGVYVELAAAVKALDNTTTGPDGSYSFPTSAHPNSTHEGNSYDLTFTLSEFKPGALSAIVASNDSANVALIPLGVTVPEQPIAQGSPRSVYVEWPANPEYNLKGYNVWRTEVTAEGNAVIVPAAKINGNPDDVYDGLITGTEFVDTNVQAAHFYVYQIQAISGGDRPSAKSLESNPPVKGDFLAIFFPNVYIQNTGLYLWERVPGESAFVRIPVSSRCAYDVSTSGMQIVATLPISLISPDTTDADIIVDPTGVTAVMGGALEYHIMPSVDPSVLELRISNASLNAQSLYGAGDLFNVYVRTLNVAEDTCGPLHLVDEIVAGVGNGVRVYDDSSPSPLKVELELQDGTLCKTAGCLYGDVDLDVDVDMADASQILKIWVKKASPPDQCWPQIGDINRDGYVDAADSTLIQRWLAGLPIAPTGAKEDLAAVSFAVAAAEKDAEEVDVHVGSVVGDPGSTVDVDVTIAGAAPTAGFEMLLTFPRGETGVTYVDNSATLGSALAGFTLDENSGTAENAANGWVSVAVSGAHAMGKAETTTLVTLRFTLGPKVTNSVPLVLSSFNQFDQFGFTPRQTSPLAPSKYNGAVNTSGVAVPNVMGMTQAAASTALTTAGLVVTVTEAFNATVPAGNVINQDPAADAIVVSGSTVVLEISLGPQTAPLTVTIGPADVVDAGRWCVDGGAWQTSGASVTVSLGNHTISFQDIAATGGGCFAPAVNWTKPDNQTITVVAGTNQATGTYTQSAGKLAAGGDLVLLGIALSALVAAGRRARKHSA